MNASSRNGTHPSLHPPKWESLEIVFQKVLNIIFLKHFSYFFNKAFNPFFGQFPTFDVQKVPLLLDAFTPNTVLERQSHPFCLTKHSECVFCYAIPGSLHCTGMGLGLIFFTQPEAEVPDGAHLGWKHGHAVILSKVVACPVEDYNTVVEIWLLVGIEEPHIYDHDY